MICPQCKKDFKPQALGQKFCSRACRNIAEGKLPKKIATPVKVIAPTIKEKKCVNPPAPPPKKIDTCRNCGKQFKPTYHGEKFCSTLCRLQFFHLDLGSDLFNISL